MRPTEMRDAVRAEIAKAMRAKIAVKFSSVAQAAEDLGIGRQRLHAYLEKKATPHADILLLAMRRWGMELRCLGVNFRCSTSRKTISPPQAAQLSLFDQPQVLDNDLVTLDLRRKDADSLKLNVEIRLRIQAS